MDLCREAGPEALASGLLEGYFALPGAPRDRVDPWRLARELLGLRVCCRRLSRSGSLLGVTSPGPLWFRVWDAPGAWEYLDGRTILLESGLAALPGRQNFTLAHELGHRLLDFFDPGQSAPLCCRTGSRDPGEKRADELAAALLMPEALVRRGLDRFALPCPVGVLNRVLDPETWRRFAALAESLGVSREALALRLRRLGLLRREWRRDPRSLLDIPPDDMEMEVLCRDST